MGDNKDLPVPGAKDLIPGDLPKEVQGSVISLIPGTQVEFRQVYLGNNGAGQFTDTAQFEMPEEGLDFQVNQNSAGWTGVTARPRKGFKIHAFAFDEKTRMPKWVDDASSDGRVSVASDRGNMSKLDPEFPWLQETLGNPGWRGGVVRVTNEATGEQQYYAIGGKYSGSPDKWFVRPAFAKVALIEPKIQGPAAPKSLETSRE